MTEIHIGYGLSPNHWFDFCHFSVVSILLNANPEDNYHFHIVSTEFPDHVLDKFFRLANFRQADFTFHFVFKRCFVLCFCGNRPLLSSNLELNSILDEVF